MISDSLSRKKSEKNTLLFLKKYVPKIANNIVAIMFLAAIVPGMLKIKTSSDNNIDINILITQLCECTKLC